MSNLQQLIHDPLGSSLIIVNLFFIESLLSVDNAAVLATMVMKLPRQDRKRALRYGIIGAYVFRGICLVLAAYLVKIWWLKGTGGIYLLYLAIQWYVKKNRVAGKVTDPDKEKSRLSPVRFGGLGPFWATVISVELMDLAFSLDNVFAAVAYSSNILIILLGVFIGILAMRFVAQGFVRLMEHYPFLEACAFTVIGLLGIKLTLSFYEHFYPGAAITQVFENPNANWITSVVTIALFLIPVTTSLLFNFPAKANKPNIEH